MFAKALVSTVTPLGTYSHPRSPQLSKAFSLISVSPEVGSVTDVRLPQSLKTPLSITPTLVPERSTRSRAMQSSKASSESVCSEFGKETVCSAALSLKACLPMVVRAVPERSTILRPEYSKASLPMVWSELGKVIVCAEVQYLNPSFPMLVRAVPARLMLERAQVLPTALSSPAKAS